MFDHMPQPTRLLRVAMLVAQFREQQAGGGIARIGVEARVDDGGGEGHTITPP